MSNRFTPLNILAQCIVVVIHFCLDGIISALHCTIHCAYSELTKNYQFNFCHCHKCVLNVNYAKPNINALQSHANHNNSNAVKCLITSQN